MNDDLDGVDTIVLGGYTNDTITLTDDYEMEDDTISLTDYSYTSPLSTSLSAGGYSYTLPTAAASITTGTVGATLSTTNTGSLMWNNPTYTATASPYSVATSTSWGNISSGHNLHVNGGAVFEEDIKVKGVMLSERLDAIEERLGILRPNNDLEGKWEKLKALGEEYRRMEKEILEGESIWETLKK